MELAAAPAEWVTCPESGGEHRDWSAFAGDTPPVVRTCPHCRLPVQLSVERDGYWRVADHAYRPKPAVLTTGATLTADQAADMRDNWAPPDPYREPLPAHFDQPEPTVGAPYAMCDRCGRTSWDPATFGRLCGLLHPGGAACRGRMLVQRPGIAR